MSYLYEIKLYPCINLNLNFLVYSGLKSYQKLAVVRIEKFITPPPRICGEFKALFGD
jgi:hypothetical protein